MKILTILFFGPLLLFAEDIGTLSLTIKVDSLKNSDGVIQFAIYKMIILSLI